jgi:hypothetical protein
MILGYNEPLCPARLWLDDQISAPLLGTFSLSDSNVEHGSRSVSVAAACFPKRGEASVLLACSMLGVLACFF